MKLLAVTARSAVLERESSTPYFSAKAFKIYLNGEAVRDCGTNVFSLYSLTPDTEYEVRVDGEALIFRTRTETAFIDVARYGTVADGIYNDTPSIQMALTTAPEGSTVYIGKGTYRVASLFMKSNITLYLEKGARLLGINDRRCYPILPSKVGESTYLTSWEGEEAPSFSADEPDLSQPGKPGI